MPLLSTLLFIQNVLRAHLGAKTKKRQNQTLTSVACMKDITPQISQNSPSAWLDNLNKFIKKYDLKTIFHFPLALLNATEILTDKDYLPCPQDFLKLSSMHSCIYEGFQH